MVMQYENDLVVESIWDFWLMVNMFFVLFFILSSSLLFFYFKQIRSKMWLQFEIFLNFVFKTSNIRAVWEYSSAFSQFDTEPPTTIFYMNACVSWTAGQPEADFMDLSKALSSFPAAFFFLLLNEDSLL